MRRFVILSAIVCGGLFLAPRMIRAQYDVRLDIPFVVQAPHANWNQPYQDACEEASVVMLDAFVRGDGRAEMTADEADRRILDIVSLERSALGYDRDTDIRVMAQIINDFFPFEAYVVDDPSLEQLLAELDAGRPMIVPLWGSYLDNPYFSPPGPTYHTVVLLGYDSERREFITHEPGTKRGKHFRYTFDSVMKGMHDFVPGVNGRPMYTGDARRVLMIRTTLGNTADTDADQDGLTKQKEMALRTSLMRSDSDGDGYIDGHEVSIGYSPLVNESALNSGNLVKENDDPRVYVLEGGFKRHIVSEQAFERAGYKWADVLVVSRVFLSSIPTR